MTSLDRTALIDLLDRLGADDDATVLEAARAVHRQAAESGLSWDALIRPDTRPDDAHRDDVGTDETDGAAVPSSPDAAEAMRLIERLQRQGVSDELREDLTEMKRQLAEGSLDPEDARYLRAVAKRLGA